MDDLNSTLEYAEINAADTIINTEQTKPDEVKVRSNEPKRCCPFVVEPLVVLIASSFYPLILCCSLYTYSKFEDAVRNETGYNPNDHVNNDTDTCNTNKSSENYIFTQMVQARNATFNIYTNLCSCLPAFFVTIFLSPYSDKAGRRYAIVPPVIAMFLHSLLAFLIILFDWSVWLFLLASFIEGAGGGMGLLFAGFYSYIADTTTVTERRFRITLIEILMLATLSCGPILFGYWIKDSGFIWPSVFTVIMQMFCMMYAIFLVPETIMKTEEKQSFFTLTHIKFGINVFRKKTIDNRRCRLLILLTVFLLAYLAFQDSDISTLFELNSPLCWDSVIIGYYNTVYLAFCSVGGIISAKLLGFCFTDNAITLLASGTTVIYYVCKGLVHTTVELFLTCAFKAVTVLLTPSVRTLMSKLVEPSEQGSVFGAIALAESAISVFGGLFYNTIYAHTLMISSGFVYFVSASVYVICTILLIIYVIISRKNTNYRQLQDVSSGQRQEDTEKLVDAVQ